uniref:Uncharacterized protein n=1 Tax=Kalanchoe fedtschenkoi TaxID=63787 RepID=A0A7N0ULR6_KALFE
MNVCNYRRKSARTSVREKGGGGKSLEILLKIEHVVQDLTYYDEMEEALYKPFYTKFET